MKIREVSIHNYRGIIDEAFKLNDYSLLIGANNGGKSTVIAAICAFYDHEPFKYSQSRDWPHLGASDNECWIEIEYELDSTEASEIKTEYLLPNGRMRLRRYLHSTSKAHDGKAKSGARFAYTSSGLTETDFYYGDRNVGKGKLGELIYIPAVSKVEDHTKLSGPSPLRDLLNDMLKDIVGSSDSYTALQSSFETFSTNVRTETTDGGRSIEGLQTSITDSLSDWGVDFQIAMKAPEPTDLVKSLTDYHLVETGTDKPLAADAFGSGFQRQLVYTLIQTRASYIEAKPSPKRKTFSPSMTLLLFEEPEAFLHPPQQLRLAENLRKIASGPTHQVLCSTHSPHYVGLQASELTGIIRCHRTGRLVSLYQLDTKTWDAIVDANSAETEEDRADIEQIHCFLWLNPDRCSAFFCDFVLLVEGKTEEVVLRRLISDGKVANVPSGTHVLDALGKFNIPRFSKLLEAMGLSHSILFDEDESKGRHADANKECRGRKKSKCVRNVVSIPKNIEHALGIATSPMKNNKPGNAILALDRNNIDADKLKTFCGVVSACFDSSL
ncbi:MAG: ATP-dependent endonuclease [Phycisphaerales bacterium JB040]